MSIEGLPSDVTLSRIPGCLDGDDPIERVWFEIEQLMQRVNRGAGPGEPRIDVHVESCAADGYCRLELSISPIPVDGDEVGWLERLFKRLGAR